MSELPDPDSRAYRALVLSGRLGCLNDIASLLGPLSERLEASDEDDIIPVMVDNWRELFAWLDQAGVEVRGELAMLREPPQS